MELNKLTIKTASKLLQKKEITSVELTKACLGRIKEVNKDINALLTVCEKEALESAKKADKRILKGEKGELLGIPYVAKDNILTKNIKTTASSKMLDNYIAPFNATIIKKLKQAGAVLVGKGNLDEFAHGASGENSAYGLTKNPLDTRRVAGGSSSGPVASVASDMCIFAIGTDTGGSIRCPSSFCGVVGLKPSYGISSRFGIIAMTSSTDTPGPITKTVEDIEIVLRAISGVDKNDATTVDSDKVFNNYSIINSENKNNKLNGIKIGVPKEFINGVDAKIQKVFLKNVNTLKELGAEIKEIKLPLAKYGIPAYYIITSSEISSNLARYDGIRFGFSEKEVENLQEVYFKNRGKSFGAEVKRRIMLGTYVLSAGYYDAYYLKAQKVRTLINKELNNELKKVNAIITPTQPDIAFKIGDMINDPVKMYLEDIFLSPASLAGLPAISIPAGVVNNMPVGLQIIGRKFDESMLFKVGHLFEKNK